MADDFDERVPAWRPDLVRGVGRVWPGLSPADRDALADRLVSVAREGYDARPADLRALDERRLAEPDWFQRSSMLGYAAYADRFGGTLEGVGRHAAYLRGLGVSYLHLMPLLTPRPGPNDGGYAVADYRTVRADLGDTDDLRALTSRLREHGISLCLDLVLNHVAREHAWAEAARSGDERRRAYFLTFPDRELPDAYERTLPEVFPDFAPGSFTWDDGLGAWVWTTFNDYQWDLDWSNPDVLCEMAAVVCHLANLGVEVLRLDAIAFLWKRMGTTCQNQPEVHELTRLLRDVARLACPAVVFKAEAIVGPADLPAYLGVGEHAGRVSDLAYHNSLMVQLWSMLATGEVTLATTALQQLPPPPSTTSWLTYARCHDDIGWAIDDADAARAGLDGAAHRRFLSDWYAGTFPGSWARGLVFQDNPATGDRRISGSLASLAGLECGDPGAVDRILLLHAVMLGFGGLPVLWMGDEVGLLNDAGWADDPEHAEDNRWVHRPRMPWRADGRPDVGAQGAAISDGIQRLVAARAALPRLHAAHATEVWDPRDPGVLLVVRRTPEGPVLVAANVSAEERVVAGDVLAWLGLQGPGLYDALGDAPPERPDGVDGPVRLAAYQVAWLYDRRSAATSAS